MSTHPPGPEWTGDMLDDTEMVAAFTAQLRRVFSDQAAYVAAIRRDAEAMWKANPPQGFGSFEAWWRHRWITGPFAEIQEHLEKAATLTFQLEARYRRGRHEIPAARQAAAEARQAVRPGQAPELGRQAHYDRGRQQPAPPRRPEAPAEDFMDLIRRDRTDRTDRRRPA